MPREIAREADEPRLVDAGGVHAGHEQDAPAAAIAGWLVARSARSEPLRDGTVRVRFVSTLARAPSRRACRAAPFRPAACTTERGAAGVGPCADDAQRDAATQAPQRSRRSDGAQNDACGSAGSPTGAARIHRRRELVRITT